MLVVAALSEEARYVEGDVEVLLTGVGKALAASTLASRLAGGPRPDLVVNIGTAGALDPSMAGIHEVDVVTQHDFPYAAIEALVGAGTPRGYALRPDAPPAPIENVRGRCVLGTGDTFVSDAAAAMSLAGRGIRLVDMEAFGLATTCAAFEVPLRCAKAVSDRADADAAESWLDLIDGCAQALGGWLRESHGGWIP
jgi:adenosylhomocysteine nucleosidase